MPAYPTPVFTTAFPAPRPDAEPLSRIVRAYDRAIQACESFNHGAARTAIGVLRSALDLECHTSRSFDALYKWCEELVDAHDFVGPARTLRALREAWYSAHIPQPIVARSDLPVS